MGANMRKPEKINFAKLPGFDAVSEELSGRVDFQDETIAARLGAKVGKPELAPVTLVEANYQPAS
jgi:hypothetical protein